MSCVIGGESLNIFYRNDGAVSQPIGVILIVTITIVLALLVLLMMNFQLFATSPEEGIPEIFTITAIESSDEITGHLNFDSRVILLHTGASAFQNNNLKARFFKNGQPVSASIITMNGHDFISTSHFGVQWMGGSGCSGTTWSPGERICIDFSDGTFHPGERVQVDIIDKEKDLLISRHTYLSS